MKVPCFKPSDNLGVVRRNLSYARSLKKQPLEKQCAHITCSTESTLLPQCLFLFILVFNQQK